MDTLGLYSLSRIRFNRPLQETLNDYSDGPIIIITDAKIFEIYKNELHPYKVMIIPESDEAKEMECIVSISNTLMEENMGRDTFLIGFGGGAVCDFTGFLASIYRRGVRFGLIPTTLLAQVDAALGGKNGVNLGDYKNILGCFNHPKFTLINPELSLTQDAVEWKLGFAEIIKHAIIEDFPFFHWLISHSQRLLERDQLLVEECVKRAVEIKLRIVEEDPLDHGNRKKLNYGHTIAHAVERKMGLQHGEAVALGIYLEGIWSVRFGLLSNIALQQIMKILHNFDLWMPRNFDVPQLIIDMLKDKKATKEYIDIVLLQDIGKSEVRRFNHSEFIDLVQSCSYE